MADFRSLSLQNFLDGCDTSSFKEISTFLATGTAMGPLYGTPVVSCNNRAFRAQRCSGGASTNSAAQSEASAEAGCGRIKRGAHRCAVFVGPFLLVTFLWASKEK